MDRNNVMSLVKQRLMLRHVFFASLLISTECVERKSIPTAATDMRKIFYNRAFMESLDRDVQLFVGAHEVLHIAFKHGLRENGRDHELWNISCDFAINIILKDAGFKIWPHAFLDKFNGKTVDFRGMSAEQIYPKLLTEAEKAGRAAIKKMLEKSGTGDDLAPGEGMSPEAREQISREITSRVAQAATAAKMCGQLGGALEHAVNGILNPPVPWQDLLVEFATRLIKQDESWAHHNRRFSDYYLPARNSLAMGEIVGIGDTSGSLIGSDIFKQVNGCIEDIREQVKPERVRWIWADDADCSKEEVFEPDEEVKLHPVGGGGTDMRKPLKFIERYEPIVAILATDGYTPWPEKPTPFPLIILCNTKTECPSWAQTIRI